MGNSRSVIELYLRIFHLTRFPISIVLSQNRCQFEIYILIDSEGGISTWSITEKYRSTENHLRAEAATKGRMSEAGKACRGIPKYYSIKQMRKVRQ